MNQRGGANTNANSTSNTNTNTKKEISPESKEWIYAVNTSYSALKSNLPEDFNDFDMPSFESIHPLIPDATQKTPFLFGEAGLPTIGNALNILLERPTTVSQFKEAVSTAETDTKNYMVELENVMREVAGMKNPIVDIQDTSSYPFFVWALIYASRTVPEIFDKPIF